FSVQRSTLAGPSPPPGATGESSARAVPRRPDDPPVASSGASSTGRGAEPVGTRRIVILSLGLGWVAGVLVRRCRWGSGWLLLRRLRRTAVPIDGASAPLFAACCRELGLRRPVALATHPAVRSPITFGLLRPVVLVPPGWPELPELVRRGILLHELA